MVAKQLVAKRVFRLIHDMIVSMKRLSWLSLFAIMMAYLEAVVVMHLRYRYYPDNPLQLFPMRPFSSQDLMIELFREAATMLMLLSVAVLSTRGFLPRFAAFVFSFGLWDIFYYIWLKVIMGWPVRWLEWDILFLLPRPWFGPWLAAALIALLFVIWGARVLISKQNHRPKARLIGLFLLGVSLDLITFLQPAFVAAQPSRFLWFLFAIGYICMAAALAYYCAQNDKQI